MKILICSSAGEEILLTGDLPSTSILYLTPDGIYRYEAVSERSNLCLTPRGIEVEE